MSFRLRIFVLVMVVAVTAIGATAWLTLSLASRQVDRTEQAQIRHQSEIADEVGRFGMQRGSWPGVDQVVARLSQRTNLHIVLRTDSDEVLADSDNIEGRRSGEVRGAPVVVDPYPAMSGAVQDRLTATGDPSTPDLRLLMSALADLYGPEPRDAPRRAPAVLMLREVAQYRAALVTVRCLHQKDGQVEPAMGAITAPFLTPQQLGADADCLKFAVDRVTTDADWLSGLRSTYRACAGNALSRGVQVDKCLGETFTYGISTTSAAPLRLTLGARPGSDVTELGRPALFGLAGLIVVAVLGTAWIARRISEPVGRLTEASRQLADGRLDVRVPATGTSELARLSASFNAMAEAVQRSEERQRRLVADVAHELRTPLSNLRGYLEGLSDGVVEPSRDLFVSLHEETLLQRRILDDLQVLALAEVGDLQYARTRIDLAELVGSAAIAQRAVAAERGVALTVDAPRQVWADADPDRVRQVLGNLLSNAVRYTDAGGHVLVRVRGEGQWASLTVQDTGVGIAAEDLPHVFDRFWRADPARQRATGGTGLGLTIAHQIVNDHGGRIHVTSEPKVGTKFTVDLPLLHGGFETVSTEVD